MFREQDSYRQVMKATSLFGGVQVINITIAIIRSKAIAIYLGPAGMGIAGLLNSTLALINGITNAGLDKSAVKDISLQKENLEEGQLQKTVSVLIKLVWITAIFGALVMILASSFLSEWAFGNREHTFSFIWISIALIFQQLSNSRLAILQGFRKLKSLAKANVLGNFTGLIITLPLYYYYGIDAIVPALIISSVAAWFFTFFYSKKIRIDSRKLSVREAVVEGKDMLKLGLTLSFSGMISLLVAYLVQVYISSEGGVGEVGFYNAGILILNSYVGLVFNAMATDYYPRLAGIADQIDKIRKAVFEQAFIAILLITPIIVMFLAFAPLIIKILYSEDFMPVLLMLNYGILGMLFKAVSFSMGYIIIAKGDSKLFVKTSVGFNSLLLAGNIFGYWYAGLTGLGISFFIYYVIHFLAVRLITSYRYNFFFQKGFYGIFVVCVFLCFTTFLITYLENEFWKYTLLLIMIILSSGFVFYQLNKKINIEEFMDKIFRRRK